MRVPQKVAARGLAEHDRAVLAGVCILIAYDALLYVTPEQWHLLEPLANPPLVSFFLPFLRILRPGRYLKRAGRRGCAFIL
jgi:hypothetical protein